MIKANNKWGVNHAESNNSFKIKLEKEAVRDLAKEIDIDGDDEPDYEDDIESGEENIPPEIYEQIMHKFMDEHYHKFIDETIPKLDGLTPREASKIPEMHPRFP